MLSLPPPALATKTTHRAPSWWPSYLTPPPLASRCTPLLWCATSAAGCTSPSSCPGARTRSVGRWGSQESTCGACLPAAVGHLAASKPLLLGFVRDCWAGGRAGSKPLRCVCCPCLTFLPPPVPRSAAPAGHPAAGALPPLQPGLGAPLQAGGEAGPGAALQPCTRLGRHRLLHGHAIM